MSRTRDLHLRASDPGRWTGWLAAAALVIVAAGLYPLFTAGEPFSPDVLFLAVPNAHFLGEQLRGFHLPLWDPYLLGGHPFLAELQTQVLYPPSLFWAFFDPHRWMGAYLALHLVFAAAGAFGLGRAFHLRPESCAVMAVALGLSPLVIEHYQHPNLLCGLCWLPWLWAAARAIARKTTATRALVLAALWFCACTSGAPELAAFGLAGAVWIARRHLGWLAVGLGAGTLLAAPAWLPFIELLRHSERAAGVLFSEVCHYELHRIELGDFFAPFAQYAEPAGLHDHYFGQLFIGASVAVLALCGRRRRWLALAAGLLVFALGSETPAFHALWTLLPPLHGARSPIKLAGVFALLFSLRAGWGFQRWRVPGGRTAAKLAIAFGALACLGIAAGGLSGTDAPWASSALWSGTCAALLFATWLLPGASARRLAALFVVAAELVAFNVTVTQEIIHAGPACAAKPELATEGRVLFDIGAGVHPPDDWTALCALGWDNRNLLVDMPSVSGFVAPAPAGIHELLRHDVPQVARTYRPSVVVLADDVARSRYPPGQVLLRRGRFTAYRIGPVVRAVLQSAGHPEPVSLAEMEPGHEVFSLPGDAGELTIFDTAFPGWQAQIDQQAVPIESRDGIDVLHVPAGARRLELKYQPRSFALGLWLFALGLLACLALVAGERFALRHAKQQAREQGARLPVVE